MIRLFLADVHANFPAFEAVLEDAPAADEIYFLGDIVGCGPHPAACVDLLRSISPRAILGNHDQAILARTPSTGPLPVPVDWDQWSRHQLSDGQIDYLSSLPIETTAQSCGRTVTLIHRSSVPIYLHPAMPDQLIATYFRDLPGDAVYCAHSHRPIDREIDGRRLVCLSTVGQPRNGDTRAGYAVEENGKLHFHSVPYDVERTIADLQPIGLHPEFLDRWMRFTRTAADPEWSREYDPNQPTEIPAFPPLNPDFGKQP